MFCTVSSTSKDETTRRNQKEEKENSKIPSTLLQVLDQTAFLTRALPPNPSNRGNARHPIDFSLLPPVKLQHESIRAALHIRVPAPLHLVTYSMLPSASGGPRSSRRPNIDPAFQTDDCWRLRACISAGSVVALRITLLFSGQSCFEEDGCNPLLNEHHGQVRERRNPTGTIHRAYPAVSIMIRTGSVDGDGVTPSRSHRPCDETLSCAVICSRKAVV